jgi:hypothetical protein
MRHALFALALPLVLCACPLGHQAPPVRAQEAASDMNMNARFGRMELAAEAVSPKAHDAFLEHRKDWGGKIRIADYELQGLKMKGDEDADIFVRIAWFRVNEGDLRVTTIHQKWHDYRGDWKLVDELRLDGDVGVLGEPPAAPSAPAGPKNAQFPTIHLGGGGMPNEEVPSTPAPTQIGTPKP